MSDCHALEDISALTYNEQGIRLAYCSKVREVLNVFVTSRRIEIEDLHPEARIDMTSWKRVQTLILGDAEYSAIEFIGDSMIPLTVKDCSLTGKYVEIVDLRLTEQHSLRRLRLANSSTLGSIADLGFERLVAIELNDLSGLTSIDGIGPSCYRVSLCYCHEIQDFSSLRNVKELCIRTCSGFSAKEHLPLLTEVRSLQLGSLNFDTSCLLLLSPYVETLDLSLVTCVSSFEGLEDIPHLRLDYCCHKDIFHNYLLQGRKPTNYRIDFLDCNYPSYISFSPLHDSYLKEDYMIFWKPWGGYHKNNGGVRLIRRPSSFN